ncbi:MAG: sugar phosphate isomerase/epimerase [Acidobacteria bacterium]|nr:sugar phosphate isomerase/epimerase [Acidobacteriota bacterium]
MNTSKRNFLKAMAAVTCASANELTSTRPSISPNGFEGTLCLFSKHLPSLSWQQLAQTVKKLGFSGVDLTVRPGGHVLPERTVEDLPKAVAAIQTQGLSVPMITTGLTSANDPTAKPILSTAGKLGIPFYKPGYYRYEFKDVRRELEKFRDEFTGLIELGKQHGIQCGFHNHEGYLGAPLWDAASVIDRLDPKWAGYYFDVRHAVVEGGGAGWKIALNLITPRLKMIAVKDFYWEKSAKGWRIVNCPLGDGMVDWKQYFKLLRQANFHGPVSLHLEYEIPGATASAKEENTIAAAQRDLEFLKQHIAEAYR